MGEGNQRGTKEQGTKRLEQEGTREEQVVDCFSRQCISRENEQPE